MIRNLVSLPWSAWDDTRTLRVVNTALRVQLRARGARDHWFEAPDGTRAHAYVAGPADGPRVVLVHGIGDSAHTWFRVLPALAAAGHRVLAVDLHGHGYTPTPAHQPFARVREQAALVDAAAGSAWSQEPFSLVGHSLGGWVAGRVVLPRPARVKHLVLIESAGLPFERMHDQVRLLRVTGESDVRVLWDAACHEVPLELRLFRADVARHLAAPAIRDFIEAEHDEDAFTEEELAALHVPTTLIWGREDGLMPPSVGERLARLIPGAALRWIPDCGHAPQMEAPAALHALLEEALPPPA